MDDNKRAYVSMAEKVDTFLQLKATELAATTADVASLQTNLHSKIDETLDNDTQANLDNSGCSRPLMRCAYCSKSWFLSANISLSSRAASEM